MDINQKNDIPETFILKEIETIFNKWFRLHKIPYPFNTSPRTPNTYTDKSPTCHPKNHLKYKCTPYHYCQS